MCINNQFTESKWFFFFIFRRHRYLFVKEKRMKCTDSLKRIHFQHKGERKKSKHNDMMKSSNQKISNAHKIFNLLFWSNKITFYLISLTFFIRRKGETTENGNSIRKMFNVVDLIRSPKKIDAVRSWFFRWSSFVTKTSELKWEYCSEKS